MPFLTTVLFLLLTLASGHTYANDGIEILSVSNTVDGSEYSTKVEILLLMTLLGFVPSIIIMCTCFTRIIIVLSLLRQALGLQQSPPNQVLAGMALIFTALIMRPVGTEIYETAYLPYKGSDINVMQMLEKAQIPLQRYMSEQTEINTYEHVLKIAGEEQAMNIEDAPFIIVLPAYLLSELKAAFQIGFMIFLPFLAIDLIVASVLMSMGMMMLSPLIVSLPFKLMAFVAMDGWNLIIGSLANSFWI